MTIMDISSLLHAQVRCAQALTGREIATAYAGDMLSDVLALGKEPDILLTGLVNPQVIRTAEMLDTPCVVFVRGKEPPESILQLGESSGVCVLTVADDMYKVCGLLYTAGLTPAQ